MNLIESIDKYKSNMLKEEKNYIYENASKISLLRNIKNILEITEDEELLDKCNSLSIDKIFTIYNWGGYKVKVYNEKTLKKFLSYEKNICEN